MDDLSKTIANLDKEEPNWFLDWATGDDLRDYARNSLNSSEEHARKLLKNRLARRIFNRVIRSALQADLIILVPRED